jgi:hypothetical protein
MIFARQIIGPTSKPRQQAGVLQKEPKHEYQTTKKDKDKTMQINNTNTGSHVCHNHPPPPSPNTYGNRTCFTSRQKPTNR